jgi:hypothetical protein
MNFRLEAHSVQQSSSADQPMKGTRGKQRNAPTLPETTGRFWQLAQTVEVPMPSNV